MSNPFRFLLRCLGVAAVLMLPPLSAPLAAREPSPASRAVAAEVRVMAARAQAVSAEEAQRRGYSGSDLRSAAGLAVAGIVAGVICLALGFWGVTRRRMALAVEAQRLAAARDASAPPGPGPLPLVRGRGRLLATAR